jgi:putative sigma-54 modulation protein
MRLDLTGRHLDITDGVRRIIEGKLARIERRMNDSAVSAQVVLSREKTGSRADVTLHARGEKFLHGAGRGVSIATAMSQAVDKLMQQAETVKGKWQARKRRATKAPAAAQAAAAASTATPPAPRRPARARLPRTLRVSRQPILVLSVGEASSRVTNGGIVIFRDAESDRLSVIYRAPDGDLTLVETE